MMIKHADISDSDLRSEIRARKINYGANLNLNIYGLLNCKSGKRMKRENRIFFTSEKAAIKNNFRPCGHCMRAEYKEWKNGTVCYKN